MANSYTRADAAKRHKLLERLLSYPRKNAHIINPITDLSHPAAASVQFSGDVTESGVARTIADEIYLDLRPLRDIFAETVETKERTRGISHTTPYRFVADFEIELPDGLMIKEIPDVLSVDNPWFVANVAYSLDGNVLRCRATVETRRLDASLDEVKAWNKAVRDVRNLSESQIILSKNN